MSRTWRVHVGSIVVRCVRFDELVGAGARTSRSTGSRRPRRTIRWPNCASACCTALPSDSAGPGTIGIDAGLTVGSQGTTDALVYAIADGNEEAARSLVEAGASSSARASASSGPMGGATPLEAARRKGNAALEDLLTSKGAR